MNELESLLQPSSMHIVAPWDGGAFVRLKSRSWKLEKRPDTWGWYVFQVQRKATPIKKAEIDPDYRLAGYQLVNGYIIGNRIIPIMCPQINLDTENLLDEVIRNSISLQIPIFEVSMFDFVEALCNLDTNKGYYLRSLFPLGPEDEVRIEYLKRSDTVNHIRHVTPSLNLAFLFLSERRRVIEQKRIELEKKRALERKRKEYENSIGTGIGRRKLAKVDFFAAAKAALALSGASLANVSSGHRKNERIIIYQFENRWFECVTDTDLNIVDSGICLKNEWTGEKGDTFFTLESLPGVIKQAIRENKLVIYRHVR